MNKNIAVILAAGQGKRMKSSIPKQYLLIKEKPILYYSIKQFEEHDGIDEIILVLEKSQVEYCKNEIIDKYNFKKITGIVNGGSERYESVYEALKSIKNTDYVLIHDGARPFIDKNIITILLKEVQVHKACIVGVPVKDTIKIVDKNNIISQTPNRNMMYMIQTPQVFEFQLIKNAYDLYISNKQCIVTDDSMVLELIYSYPVKLIEGDYNNIKITTSEDIIIAESILNKNIASY